MAKGKGKTLKTPRGAVRRENKLKAEEDLELYTPEEFFYEDEEKIFASMVRFLWYFQYMQ